jgi:hypothetical protein
MGTHIHIRDFDDKLHAKLVRKAGAEDLSLSQYLRLELAKLARSPSSKEIGDMLVNLPRAGHVQPWSSRQTVQMLHEGREERDEQVSKRLSKHAAEN